MFFFVITKNLSWEILAKNLVTYKKVGRGGRWEILILWGFTEKIRFLGRGFTKKNYIGGTCLKKGAWTVCRFKRGLAKKEEDAVF